ncbi:hypothetical protein T459_08866 [Capsicum annuum]|uniref:G-patch domain-containing protein n=1 Tax=Capsicum annuum TaxID=4072 RepID=A0A2G2ZXP3_CAPAN|nr:hypothetical protein T459_08866 [Capsicum annuum]
MLTVQEVDLYEDMEKKVRSKAYENIAKEIGSLKEAFRSIQQHKGCEGLEYEDLCIHPDVEMSIGYKVPLDEGGEKIDESFKEYAMQWREDAIKVQPPMAESEMTSLFVQSQKDATYYDKIIIVVAQKFSEEKSVPIIERMEHLDGSVFHVKEIMCTAQVESLKLPRVLMMVTLEILKNGFVPGRGLGVNLDGILEPIQLFKQKNTFGLGYESTLVEVSSANL